MIKVLESSHLLGEALFGALNAQPRTDYSNRGRIIGSVVTGESVREVGSTRIPAVLLGVVASRG